jgi:Putative beta barrel porin-7 (BBP7)
LTILGMRDGPRAATMMDLSSKEYAMRSYCPRSVFLTLGFVLAGTASTMAFGQEFGSPKLLPISGDDNYTASLAAHQDAVVVEAAPSDNPATGNTLPSPSDATVQAPESYKSAMQLWGANSCTAPTCGSAVGDCGTGCGTGCDNGCGYWFGSVGALIMGSPGRHNTFVSNDSATLLPVLQTGQLNNVFSGGIDVTAGRMFGCGDRGLAMTYWGIFPSAQQADVFNSSVTGTLGSSLNFTGLDYNGGPATASFNNAVHQRLITDQNINSLELNFLGNCGCGLWGCSPCTCSGPCGPRLGTGWMMGVRYFQFNDDFRFYSDNLDNTFDGSANEIQYRVSTRNNMVGFQLGGGLNYRLWNCFSLYGTAKAGIYGNHAIVSQAVYGSAGDATINSGLFAGTAYRFQSSQNNLAFLGQLDMGGRYQMNKCWSINGGYRLVGINGLALTDSQIPSNFAQLPNVQRVQSGDGLILHGAYIGAMYCW